MTAGSGADATGAGQFAVAPTGALAWIPGPVMPYEERRLVTLDRRGQVTALPVPARGFGPAVRVSPDQRRLAVTLRDATTVGLWVYDLVRPSPLLPLTTEGEVSFPLWCRGGHELAFAWVTHGREVLATQLADGTARPRELASSSVSPSSLARDGRQLAAVSLGDIVIVSIEDGNLRMEPLTETPDTIEQWPEFSPDGRWLAYGSNVADRFEVCVRAYPGAGEAFPVSAEGGKSPAWNPNGREIFLVSPLDPAGRRRTMAVEFAPGSPPRLGRPRELFSFDQQGLLMVCNPIR